MREPFSRREDREGPVPQSVQSSAAGADPETSLAVLGDRVHDPARQTLLGSERRGPSFLDTKKPSTSRPDPEDSLPILVDSKDGAFGRRRCARGEDMKGESTVLEAVEPSVRPDPEPPCFVFADGLDGQLRGTIGGPVGLDDAVPPSVQSPALGADPEIAALVHVDDPDQVACETLVDGENVEAFVVRGREPQATDAPAIRADPEAALRILHDRSDRTVRQPLGGRVGREGVVSEPGQASAFGADPESPQVIFVERPDVAAAEARGIAGVVD